jgi:TetR/AcrR family transcriptional regulator
MRLQQVARRVGIQKASLFHYFPSKEDLYRAVVDEGFQQTEQVLRDAITGNGSPRERIRALVAKYIDFVAAHPARTKILLRRSLGDAPKLHRTDDSERLLGAVAELVAAIQQGERRTLVDAFGLVLSVVGMVAFFFTSGPVLAPSWFHDGASRAANVERIKRLVIEIVDRCLEAERGDDANGVALARVVQAVARP